MSETAVIPNIPSWHRALTLAERRDRGMANWPSANPEAGRERLDRWKTQLPFQDCIPFSERLAIDGLDEDQLLRLLSHGDELTLSGGALPPWLSELQAMLSEPGEPQSWDGETGLSEESRLFLCLVEPFFRHGLRQLHQGVEDLLRTHPDLPVKPDAYVRMTAGNLAAQMVRLVSRTLVLELNVSRVLGQLEAPTATGRFAEFMQGLRQPERRAEILSEYPVIARQAVATVAYWVEFNLEFLTHLAADWAEIQSAFAPEDAPGCLVAIAQDAGDRHRGGKSVRIAQFASGFRVVYKPKPLSVDRHFQELLTWLNANGFVPALRTLNLLDKGEHGWVEYVSVSPCASRAEVERFYERQGGYLALLYVLDAVDFHYENVLAAGEHPVMIDLEALFHPRFADEAPANASEHAFLKVARSVMRVGLLPNRMLASDESPGFDISGLGSPVGQLSPMKVSCWAANGTDEMRFDHRRMPLEGSQNQPQLEGGTIQVQDFARQLVRGFETVYRLLIHKREALLAEDGPLARFARDEIRVILRSTAAYATLLEASHHPDAMRDALDREQLLDRLWLFPKESSWYRRAVAAERSDLLNGDIPMFLTTPASMDLTTSAGEVIQGFFSRTGLDAVRQRVTELSDEDMAQQVWFIRASLGSLTQQSDMAAPRDYSSLPAAAAAVEDGDLLAEAERVGDRLAALAIRGRDEATWIGISALHYPYCSVEPVGLDLYDGLPGIVLFLAQLGVITGKARFAELAEQGLKTLQLQVKAGRQALRSIGGFSGWGGLIYTYAQLGQWLDRPDLIAESESFVELLPPLIEKDEFLDVIGGSAGCIFGLLSLHRITNSEASLRAALQCGERILQNAQPMENGTGWVTKASSKPLTGFSHGASGFAAALVALSAESGDSRYQKAALGGFDYERSLFSPRLENWPDLRDVTISGAARTPVENACSAWCHGAAGIGLARLEALRFLDDSRLRDDVQAAINATMRLGFGINHSLCHGDLGNADLLLSASLCLPESSMRAALAHHRSVILDSIATRGWVCGNPQGAEAPGLMTGLAGIGYGLLRLAAPARVAPVLVLRGVSSGAAACA